MTETSDEQAATDIASHYLAAMRRGAAAETEMLAMFADDAVYDEPFSGLEPAVGKAAIRDRLRAGWDVPLPDFELDVRSIEASPSGATARWECRSSAFEHPVDGTDRYTIADGLITELVVTLDDGG